MRELTVFVSSVQKELEDERLVEESRDRFHPVFKVASALDRIDRARGHRPRGVLVCGGAYRKGAGSRWSQIATTFLWDKRSERK